MRYWIVLCLLALSGLLGCTTTLMDSALTATPGWIPDDGAIELTPEYRVTHVQGEPFSLVSAKFRSIERKMDVHLRSGDSISVNGHVLALHDLPGVFTYSAKIPTIEGTFTFELKRDARPAMLHSFELPAINVPHVPKYYSYYYALGTTYVPVNYVKPPPYVTETYDMDILIPGEPVALVSNVHSPNGYHIERFPDIRNGEIRFTNLIGIVPKNGHYPATLTHEYRIVLSEMSDASPTGWATLINVQKFPIEVR